MNDSNVSLERRLLLLLESAREGDQIARASLNDIVRNDPHARAVLSRLLADEHALLEHLRDDGIATLLSPAPAIGRPATRPPASRWRTLSAAAAGLILGLASASLLFGFTHVTSAPRQLPIADPGFEANVAPLAGGIPSGFGVWSGDFAKSVGQEQGITPHEGKHMLRFVRSDSQDPAPARANHGNLYQFIDLRSLRATISDGTATVDWSAWFNRVAERSAAPTQFEASMWAFSGDPSVVRANWVGNLHQELAYSTWRIISDDDPKTWQKVSGSLIVPPNTDFLVIELKAMPGDQSPKDEVFHFAGHYADDVQLTLRRYAHPKP